MITLHGVDFTSAPRPRKPITVASAQWSVGDTGPRTAPDAAANAAVSTAAEPCRLRITRIEALPTLEAFDAWLTQPGPWLAAFDFPFSFARDFIAAQGWPVDGEEPWPAVMQAVAALDRPALIARCRAWCDARPPGSKFAHRACDAGAGSSPSMKWVNPPVALMLHAGATRLAAAGVTVPGLRETGTDPQRIALEGYPGLLARRVLGRTSYKSDDPARRGDPARRAARAQLIEALEAGAVVPGLAVDLGAARTGCLEDDSADRLDAVLCLVQAAWAARQGPPHYGLPQRKDRVEGWIVGA